MDPLRERGVEVDGSDGRRVGNDDGAAGGGGEREDKVESGFEFVRGRGIQECIETLTSTWQTRMSMQIPSYAFSVNLTFLPNTTTTTVSPDLLSCHAHLITHDPNRTSGRRMTPPPTIFQF